MRILYLKDSFEPRYSMRDEVQVIVRAAEEGHAVTMMTSNRDLDLRPHNMDFFKVHDEALSEVGIVRYKSFKPPLFNFCVYVPNRKVLSGDWDVIHAHNIGSYSSFLAGILKVERKVPMVFKADLGNVFYKKLKNNYLLRKVVLRPVHLADAITAFTTTEKSFLIGLGIPANKIWIIPVGINYNEFSNLKNKATDLVTVGYLGRFTIQKGIHNIIKPIERIMNEHSNVRILFAGQKTDIKYAESIITELARYDRFDYVGSVNTSKDFYSQADIIIIPSLWETGSIVTLEAMASGKAVIASDINPHRDYIEHGVSGFLAKNEDDFYSYCKELIDNEDLRKTMGENAIKMIKKYDWENVFSKVEEIYNSVIDWKVH